MPFVEAKYPADPARRGLMGNSLGGLFALYAMFSEPELFAGYVGGESGGDLRDSVSHSRRKPTTHVHTRRCRARLFVAVGSDRSRWPHRSTSSFDNCAAGTTPISRSSHASSLEERHSGNKPEGLNRGMRFLFRDTTAAAEPRAPVTIGSIERLDAALNALIARDARIEKLADGFDWAEGPVWRKRRSSAVQRMCRRTRSTNGRRVRAFPCSCARPVTSAQIRRGVSWAATVSRSTRATRW